MKQSIKNRYLFFAIIVIVTQVSCSKEIFTKANDNPNAPTTLTPANILPGIETSLAYIQGGDIARFSSLLVQQDVGFSRQAQAYYSYVFTSTDFDTPWGNMYTSVLGNDKDLLNKSDAAGFNVYSGAGRLILAYSLQLLVDNWGSVPYKEALQGENQTHPAFDDEKSLYDTIENLIDVAIGQLNNADPGAQTPGTDDIIFGGDPSLWIKFGHAIKARLYIHQSKGDASMAAKALTEANLSFTSNDDNAQFIFGTTETFSNPIYQFNEQRSDIDYGSGYFLDLLTSLNDPRIGVTTDPTYSDDFQDGVGLYYGGINGHVEFIMYEEIEFLKAEATLRTTGNYAAAQAFYQAGIQASMDKLGIDAAASADYIAANGTLPTTGVDAAIAAVSTQEYISLYQNPEAFTLWRRTASPHLDAVAGTNGVPRRYLYPQSEYSLNASNTPAATLFSPKVFWDK